MSRQLLFCSMFCSGVLSSGCAEKVKAPLTASTQQESSKAGSSDNGPAGKIPSLERDEPDQPVNVVEISEATWSELQSLVAEHKGKVVVVDVWSTACEPCMKEFPHLIRLHQRLPDDVVAISFDIDFAGIKNKPVSFYRERVVKFLGSQAENKVLHRMCTMSADELFTELNLDSIPAIYVYGRDGVLAKRFDGSTSGGGEVSYEKQVNPFVDDLVKLP